MPAPNLPIVSPYDPNTETNNLKLAFDNLTVQLAEMLKHPQPQNTNYISMLIQQRALLRRAIQDSEAPMTIISRGSPG